MAKFDDKFKFEIQYGVAWTTVLPTIPGFSLSKIRENGQFFHRLELDTELVLRQAAWAYIRDIELTDHCADLNMRIIYRPQNLTLFEGKISLNDGSFDFFICRAGLKATPNDDFTCLFENWEAEVDLTEITDKQTVRTYLGTIETQTCGPDIITPATFFTENDTCITSGQGWVVIRNQASSGLAPDQFIVETTWAREFVSGIVQPPGDGWFAVSGGFARILNTYLDTENSDFDESDGTVVYLYKVPGYNTESDTVIAYDNGFLLSDALEELLPEDCGISVVSNLFSINADGTAPSNTVYTSTVLERLENIILWPKSDIKRPEVSNPATIANATLKNLLAWLENTFQAFAVMDGSTLRIEHVSYYPASSTSLDLTTAAYERWVKNKNRYTYRAENPRFEKFSWMDSAVSAVFKGKEFEYSAACSTRGGSNSEDHRADGITTDFSAIHNNPNSFADDGFFMANAIVYNGDYYFEFVNVPGHGITINGYLSFTMLHPTFWKHYRYQSSFNMNGTATTALSVRPSKKQEPITIPNFSASDFINLDPSGLVSVPLGDGNSNGEIEKATWDNNGTLRLELIH